MKDSVSNSIMIDDLESETAPAGSSGSVVIEIIAVLYLLGALPGQRG
jgi:hypothetical protein